ncbi:hypothetical protein BTR23_05555 [Alkalihalophilus pseudofirmus]|nr:hypothetical protein BTR23_05555 [Alkalihalophilus pseudofirmus]
MKSKYGVHLIIFVFIFIIAYGTTQNPFTVNYIDQLKQESIMVTKMQDPLYEQIAIEAQKYEKPPIDAIVDRVWKAVPGYNGVQVDIEASYEKMKKQGSFDKQKLVFREVKPKVHLDDLPPTPIYKGNPEKPMVSLLVNVAWGNEYLPDMLKVMNKYDVKSTFFLDGSWVKNNPKLAKMVLEEGHEIGNHAYSHPDMKQLSPSRISEELNKTNEVIYATLEVTPKWFAPPSGSFRQEVVDIAASLNMKTIMWSVDTVDWKRPDPHSMVQRVLNNVHPGAMILMHPTSSTAAGLEQMIVGIKNKGYQIGNVSHLMDESRINFGVTLN